MYRPTRLTVLAPLLAGAFVLGPASFAWAQSAPAAAPTATCSISGVFPATGKVHLSGGGFTPGPAFLSSPTAAGGSFEVAENGGFQFLNVENAQYTVTQSGQHTQCSGFMGTE
ncbi:hypothetical protein [Streptomyces sp. NBC_01408]|uniref:hypothetical protein n=1 Tax=Streptomyces sp. NBC_01408 TaxID=2903855 RepID=UPI00225905A4|nr:hypothetical protein [Streptomyces sp. NBC_01408]MCX4695370.1 hypothetical protein [Streptomyces sp. NBC_01408]